MSDEPSARALQRWHLQVALGTCDLGKWYGRVTGDVVLALRFENLLQKMLRGLEQEPARRGEQAPKGGGLAPASSPEAEPKYKQLTLLQ